MVMCRSNPALEPRDILQGKVGRKVRQMNLQADFYFMHNVFPGSWTDGNGNTSGVSGLIRYHGDITHAVSEMVLLMLLSPTSFERKWYNLTTWQL